MRRAVGSLGWTSYLTGRVQEASRWLVRSMIGYFALRDVATTTVTIPAGAIMALEAGRPPSEAAVLLGAAVELVVRIGDEFRQDQ